MLFFPPVKTLKIGKKKKGERSSILPLRFEISLNLLTLWYSQKHLSACYRTTLHFYNTLRISSSKYSTTFWTLLLSLRCFSAMRPSTMAATSPISHFTLLATEDHVPGTFISLFPTLLDVIWTLWGRRQSGLCMRNPFDGISVHLFCLPGSRGVAPYLAFPRPNKQKWGKVCVPSREIHYSIFITQPTKTPFIQCYPNSLTQGKKVTMIVLEHFSEHTSFKPVYSQTVSCGYTIWDWIRFLFLFFLKAASSQ